MEDPFLHFIAAIFVTPYPIGNIFSRPRLVVAFAEHTSKT